jgi:hypothetical protein
MLVADHRALHASQMAGERLGAQLPGVVRHGFEAGEPRLWRAGYARAWCVATGSLIAITQCVAVPSGLAPIPA